MVSRWLANQFWLEFSSNSSQVFTHRKGPGAVGTFFCGRPTFGRQAKKLNPKAVFCPPKSSDMLRKVFFLALLGVQPLLHAQELTLLFLGDIMQHDGQIASALNPKTKEYEYDTCFAYIRTLLSSAGLTIGNLEFTFGGAPYKGYPMFSAPDELGAAIQRAGVDILVTANNHSCDTRKAGIIRTLDVLDTLGIRHTGTFRHQAEKDILYPMLIEENGIRLALLNYTYGTNGLPVPAPGMVNLIDVDQMKKDLVKARLYDPDKIIVFIHWGDEYTHVPNPQQKSLADMLFKNGADIIIGAHPHVLQPMYKGTEEEGGRLLIYSLGNFISNQRTAPRDGGAMVKFTLVKDETGTRIEEAGYVLTWVWTPTLAGRKYFHVVPVGHFEIERGSMDAASYTLMMNYAKAMRKLLSEKNQAMPEYIFSDAEGQWFLKEQELETK
jgi:poly-gamma-glutamate capsule biosynthesis protein CapA/YwtB (metallophosphatase superfamily)